MGVKNGETLLNALLLVIYCGAFIIGLNILIVLVASFSCSHKLAIDIKDLSTFKPNCSTT